MAAKTITRTSEHIVEKEGSIASSTPSASWRGWLWDSADVSKEERRFLLKVGIRPRLRALILTGNSLTYPF
jgi:hypothetical protein